MPKATPAKPVIGWDDVLGLDTIRLGDDSSPVEVRNPAGMTFVERAAAGRACQRWQNAVNKSIDMDTEEAEAIAAAASVEGLARAAVAAVVTDAGAVDGCDYGRLEVVLQSFLVRLTAMNTSIRRAVAPAPKPSRLKS